MNRATEGKGIVHKVVDFIEVSSRRCHWIGMIPATLLAAAVVFTSSRGVAFWNTEHPDATVSASESLVLCRSADFWYERDALTLKQSKAIAAEQHELTQWIDDAADWQHELKSIRRLADESGVLIEISSTPTQQTGHRVSVLEITLDVAGEYESVLSFANQLSTGDRPYWCSVIEIRREKPAPNFGSTEPESQEEVDQLVTVSADIQDDLQADHEPNVASPSAEQGADQRLSDKSTRTARIVLRIPYAGDGSAAGRLWQSVQETSNGK